MKNRILPLLLCFLLVLSLLPASALADGCCYGGSFTGNRNGVDLYDGRVSVSGSDLARFSSDDPRCCVTLSGDLEGEPVSAGSWNEKIIGEGDTGIDVHWTLYQDGTLHIRSDSRYAFYSALDDQDNKWANMDFAVINPDRPKEASQLVRGKDLVTALVVEPGIGWIPEKMFMEYPNLKTVVLPKLREIGKHAFRGCERLESVTINGSVDRIREFAFDDCTALKTVTIHGDVGVYESGIGDSALRDCTNLTDFTADGLIWGLADDAFQNCPSLKHFNAAVEGDIGAGAFASCRALRQIPPIRGSVGKSALAGSGMGGRNLYIVSGHDGWMSDSSVILDVHAMKYYAELFPVLRFTGTREEFAQRYESRRSAKAFFQCLGDHVTWSLDGNGVLTISGFGPTIDLLNSLEQPWLNIPGRSNVENLARITKVRLAASVIPGSCLLDGLEDVELEIFSEHSGSLEPVDWTLNEGVLTFSGSGAIPGLYGADSDWLAYRTEIREIVIQDGITGVGAGCFTQCRNLDRITFPDSLKTIGANAFSGCARMEQVSLPAGLASLGGSAFSGCAGLRKIFIPGTVASIGSGAFSDTGLRDVFYGGSESQWNALNVSDLGSPKLHFDAKSLPPSAEEHVHCAFCTAPEVCIYCGETAEDPVILHSYRLERDADCHSYVCAGCGDVEVTLRHYTACTDPDAEVCDFCGYPLEEGFPCEKGIHTGAFDRITEEDGIFYHETICTDCGETVLEKHRVELRAEDAGEEGWHALVCVRDDYIVDLEEHSWVPDEAGGKEVCRACGAVRASAVCTVTFRSGGHGQAPEAQNVTPGDTAAKPDDPAAAGYVFRGWYTEPECVNAYDFSAPVTEDLTLYAKWTVRSSGGGGGGGGGTAAPVRPAEPEPEAPAPVTPEPVPADEDCPKDAACPISRFRDTKATEWYHDGVHWALEKGVMNGVADDRFDPDGTATRAMVVTMLWRLEGEPEGKDAPFTDVAGDAWYARAVRWASETGIVKGLTADEFGPDVPVTREQLAAILYRCAQAKGQGFTGMWAFPLDFKNAAEVSEFAYEPMCWMTMNGIITGMGGGRLAPLDNATRAQIATMFLRYADGMERSAERTRSE